MNNTIPKAILVKQLNDWINRARRNKTEVDVLSFVLGACAVLHIMSRQTKEQTH